MVDEQGNKQRQGINNEKYWRTCDIALGVWLDWVGDKLHKAKTTREIPVGESSPPVNLRNSQGGNAKLSAYETNPSDITGATEIRIGGKLVLTTPKARSMTYEDADMWYRAQVPKIPEMIDSSLSPQLQALQAWQLRQQIRSASTAALIDQESVRYFEACHHLGSVEQALSKLAQDASGNSLFKKVVDASGKLNDIRYPNEVGGCFVAGTPVWTDKGLVPIEQIRVGDQVLSQPEGKGEVVYKTVVKTHVFDDKEICRLNYYHVDLDEDFDVFVTGNHPFWVKDVGWTAAARLSTDDQLELQDGGLAFVVRLVRVFRTDVENVGWATLYEEDSGVEFDFRNGGIRMGTDWVFNDKYLDSREKNPYFRSKVFNIEVDGFHTYYVGEHGIWVHNLNCFEAGVVLEEPSRGGAPGKEIDVFESETVC